MMQMPLPRLRVTVRVKLCEWACQPALENAETLVVLFIATQIVRRRIA